MDEKTVNSKQGTAAPAFGRVRALLWPIHGFELKKFLPMFMMFFFVSFNYSLLRVTKDSLVTNATGGGAEVLPFLKTFVTLPAAIIFMAIYVKLATFLKRDQLFYAVLAPFLAFFTLFPYVILPAIDWLHPSQSADWLLSVLPKGLAGLVAVYRNWTFSLFFIFAELWGSVVLSTLYWGFVNEITKVGEAKRFYGLLGIGANLALLFVKPAAKLALAAGDWNASLVVITNLAAVGCVAVGGLYWFINNKVMVDPQFAIEAPKSKKSKAKLGFWDSMRELAGSRYLACIALLVLCYGVSINLVEVSWKHFVKVYVQNDSQAMLDFQSTFMSATGLATILLMFFGTSNVLRLYGWGVAALLTPIMVLVTSVFFFSGLTFEQVLMGFVATLGMTPLAMAVWAGGIQNVLSKSTKYAFFDPTKEMAYIPLDDQTRRTGKAAIDGVGGRLGKSGGSVINLALLMMLGSIEAIVPYVAVIVLAVVGVWIAAVVALNKRFVAITAEGAAAQKKGSEAPGKGSSMNGAAPAGA